MFSGQVILQVDVWYLVLVCIPRVLICCCCWKSCKTGWVDHAALHGRLLLRKVTAHNRCSHIGVHLGALSLQEQGTLALAEGLCMRLLDYGASSKERAKALLREIRALQVGPAVTPCRTGLPMRAAVT